MHAFLNRSRLEGLAGTTATFTRGGEVGGKSVAVSAGVAIIAEAAAAPADTPSRTTSEVQGEDWAEASVPSSMPRLRLTIKNRGNRMRDGSIK